MGRPFPLPPSPARPLRQNRARKGICIFLLAPTKVRVGRSSKNKARSAKGLRYSSRSLLVTLNSFPKSSPALDPDHNCNGKVCTEPGSFGSNLDDNLRLGKTFQPGRSRSQSVG